MTAYKLLTTIAACSAPLMWSNRPGATSAEQLADMHWLAGGWEAPMSGGTFVAYYCTPEGGKVISYNKLTQNGRTLFHEFEVFEVQDGKVRFLAFPRGKPATPMTLTQCDAQAQKAVFENPDKDFPTRIVYHRIAEDRLVITLSDPYHNSDKVQVFDLKRRSGD